MSANSRPEALKETGASRRDDSDRELDPAALGPPDVAVTDGRRAFPTVDHLAAVPLAATWTEWGRTDLSHAYWDHVTGRWRAPGRTDGAR